MTSGVYAIINTVTGARYIGSTKDFETRGRAHRTGLRTAGNHPNAQLLNAIWKHGPDAFSIELIEEVDPDDDALEAAEQRWLAHYASLDRTLLYNVDLTGRRPRIAERRRPGQPGPGGAATREGEP